YDLHVIDLAAGRDIVVAADTHLPAYSRPAWSPDSENIAYLDVRNEHVDEGNRDRKAPVRLMVTSRAGKNRAVSADTSPVLSGRGGVVWSADSRQLYTIGLDGKLWRFELESGASRPFAVEGNRTALKLVTPDEAGGAPVQATGLLVADAQRQSAITLYSF